MSPKARADTSSASKTNSCAECARLKLRVRRLRGLRGPTAGADHAVFAVLAMHELRSAGLRRTLSHSGDGTKVLTSRR